MDTVASKVSGGDNGKTMITLFSFRLKFQQALPNHMQID